MSNQRIKRCERTHVVELAFPLIDIKDVAMSFGHYFDSPVLEATKLVIATPSG